MSNTTIHFALCRYHASAAPNYYVGSYGNPTCTGSPSSTTTNSLGSCVYRSGGTIPIYGFSNNFYCNYYATSQCVSGYTVAPTPSIPTPNPSPTPTVAPTPVAQATGFLTQYFYTSSTCSGTPNSISVYSLGICFPVVYYTGTTYYMKYTQGRASSPRSISLVQTVYYDSLCTSVQSTSSSSLGTTCSNGYNYSTSVPSVPQSVATRFAWNASCTYLR
jgi:hypothetical protein